MKVFTIVWYAAVLFWVIGGAGFGTLNYWWFLMSPAPYWLGRQMFARTGLRAWNWLAIVGAALMILVLALLIADIIASSLPPQKWY
jgi:isoprenylcysteine carboxyl methyltransferase (ICMT) family protein YpbQ